MSRKWSVVSIVLAVSACLAPAPLLADTVTLSAAKDNTLYEPISQDAYADVSDGAGATMFTGKVKDALNQAGQVAVRRAVIEFDVAGTIPAGAIIDSVQLTMVCDKVAQNTNFNVSLHRALSEWGEGTSNTGNSRQGRGEPATTNDATWRHTFYSTQFWGTPGGDYTATASATRTVGPTGSYTWGSTSGMVSDVQAWLNSASQNHGWIVIGTETQTQTTKRFATRENGTVNNRPKLVINYTPQTIQGACCNDATCSLTAPAACTLPGSYQGDGTTCTPNPCVVLTGACCANNGTCSEVTQTSCTAAGGSYHGDSSSCATTECSIVLTPYLDPLPIPPTATPVSGTAGGVATYNLAMKESQVSLHSQLSLTTVWGYDDGTHGGGILGPVIEAHSNQAVTVNWTNDLRVFATGQLRTTHYLPVDTNCIMGAENNAKTVVHLHGGHVPAAVDGYPESTFLPGDPPETYVYPNNQQAGYLWYHDHALGITRLNVYMGLAGLYFLRDSVEDALNLPVGEFEIPLVIQDRKFNPDGSFNYPATWEDHFFGDKIMVNGKVWPYLDVKKGKYRFRILNGSGSRVYTLSLSPPSGALTFTVIGDELGLLEAPVNGVGQLTIAPGERYDVVVNFAGLNTGDAVLLENGAGAPFPNGPVDVTDVMKFRVTSLAGDTDALPSTLRTITHLNPADAVRTRDLRLKRSGDDGCGRQPWLINDLSWNDITEYPELGTIEIWRFINDSGVSHPMHMHLVAFQILDRDGFTTGPGGEIIPNGNPQAPPAEESGWKDTALVAPNQILRVIARFDDYKGRYPYHCHILEHEDHDMMRQFQTVQCGDGVLDPSETCDDGAKSNLDGCNASCQVEEFLELSGVAQGGSVSMTVSGQVVSVTTTAGQTSDQVAQALADAINANTALQAAGVTATAQGSRVITNGDISSATVADTGLQNVFDLRVEKTRLWWGSLGGAAGYDVVRGDLGTLRSTAGDYADPTTTQICLANDRVDTFWVHDEAPAPGQGVWYLVRGTPGGTYDDGSPSQSGTRDAEIAASGNGCP
jgi:cysteine-rich repeat protein